MVQLIAIGEESAQLDNMLTQAADTYDDDIAQTLNRFGSILTPVMTLGLGLIVALIIGSILTAVISINDLALAANMSRSAFHRAFRDVLGEPPLQYLKQLRLNTARNRITYEDQPVRRDEQRGEHDRGEQAPLELQNLPHPPAREEQPDDQHPARDPDRRFDRS